MSKINSSKVKILVSGVAISNLTNVTMSIGADMIDVTTKDSAGWAEFLAGKKNVTMTGEGIVDFSATTPPSTIFTSYLSTGTSAAVIFSDGTASTGKSYTATAFFDKLEYKAETEGNFSFSFSLKITGTPAQVAST